MLARIKELEENREQLLEATKFQLNVIVFRLLVNRNLKKKMKNSIKRSNNYKNVKDMLNKSHINQPKLAIPNQQINQRK